MPRSSKFIKNILIRNLQESDQEMIVLIKKETGHNQASKALLTIGHAYLRLLDANQRDKQKIKALEDENEKMRLLLFKGCTHPKDITCIDNGSKKCAVFEGFFDMLSYMQLMKNKPELQSVNVVVLNSTAMVSKATEFIQKHKMVHSFLDNDASGRSCFQVIKRMGVEAVNESEYLYPQHNDLNAYLQESIKKKQMNDSLGESPQQKEKEVKSQLKI